MIELGEFTDVFARPAEGEGGAVTRQDVVGPEGRRLMEATRLAFVSRTLETAREEVPYYRRELPLHGLAAGQFQRLSDLLRLPLMNRSTLLKHRAELVNDTTHIAEIHCTGGTSGRRLALFRTREENEALAGLHSQSSGVNAQDAREIVLRVLPVSARLASDASALGTNLVLTMYYGVESIVTYRENYVDHLIRTLCDDLPVNGTRGRVSVLHVTPPFMARLITETLEMRRFDPRDIGLRAIVCTGGHVTAFLREYLETRWGAPVLTSYSCTEVNGSATAIDKTVDTYRFDMTCLAEIVDPNSASNDASEGPIALTTLAPFHRGTLLIRYQNGDFVRRVRDDWDSPFSATFKFLGRAGQCLDLTQFVGQGEDARYLGTAEAQEALDRFPEVPYVYYPRFRFDLEPGPRLQVSVEVYSCFGGLRDQRLRERIIEALISTSPALAAAVRTSHLDVDVQLFQPDDLDHAFRLNP